MSEDAPTFSFCVNGQAVLINANGATRLSTVLRRDLGLTGTKIGCEAGDCGACTVLLNGRQVCACMIPVGRVTGQLVMTVEGLGEDSKFARLRRAIHEFGAAQCGVCTPGMLIAAADLMERSHGEAVSERMVKDALGGVLCRCTGYRKIIMAVLSAINHLDLEDPDENSISPHRSVGTRVPSIDGLSKLNGKQKFAADCAPNDALWVRVIRSPHSHARFRLGSFDELQSRHPGLERVLTCSDVPGHNGFGIYPHLKEQPVLARDYVRYRGEAIVALIGDGDEIDRITEEELPIEWQSLPAIDTMDEALSPDAAILHEDRPGNILSSGVVCKGDVTAAFDGSDVFADGTWETPFVEHAYIEPEAGFAIRKGNRIEIHACTQAPYMDRDEVANVIGITAKQVRIVPTACGGGFGGKLDVSVQPILAIGAWLLDRPVRCILTRPDSMMSSTKRHPSRISARFGATRDGKLTGVKFRGDFDTGAYASWGPTVADRVPVHASGPYFVPSIDARTRAIHTNGPPSGAFRGFGVPQAALAHEGLMDELAEKLGIDPLEFRLINALRAGEKTATSQELQTSVGLVQCLEALKARWHDWRAEADRANAGAAQIRRGVGIGCMWYGIGNTSMSNPSTINVGIDSNGKLTLYNGAQDIGQGSATIMIQICADSLGVPFESFEYVMGDTDRTEDAGKTSASRQTLVSGNAALLAGADLRAQILRLSNASPTATIEIGNGAIRVSEDYLNHVIDLSHLPIGDNGDVLVGLGNFDPPTTPLDDNGQGVPYATYGFAAQIAEVEVDMELGRVYPRRILAAHDVGKAINPTQVEGQIQGGIAQGLGLALMEEYVPGKTENLHDYLIPTIGDVPDIECIIIEDEEPLGPFGAKGIGEPALIPTAPALLSAINQATGVRLRRVPATPARVRQAILENGRLGI